MGTTSNRSYPYPAGSDAVDVPGDIQALADDVDTDMAAVIAGTGLADGAVTDAKLAVPKVDQSVVGNLLTANVATGTDTLGDTTGFYAAGVATLSSDATESYQGSRSLKADAPSAGTYGANTASTSAATQQPVTAGQVYTFSAWVKTSVDRNVTPRIYWRNASGGALSSTTGTSVLCTSAGWSFVQMSATAPAGAFLSVGELTGQAVGAEQMYIDQVGFWQGAGGLWAPPGTPIANLGTYTDESVGRRIFTWDAVNARWQMTYGDTGWRNVSAGLLNSWSGTLLVRRQNDRVTAVIKTLSGASTFAQMYTLPAGFGSGDTNVHGSAVFREGGVTGTPGWMTMAGSVLPQYGGLFSGPWSASHSVTLCQVSWSTAQAWPTSLPGTASGSIPS